LGNWVKKASILFLCRIGGLCYYVLIMSLCPNRWVHISVVSRPKISTVESRFLEPPIARETEIGSKNREFEKSKVA